MYPVFGGSVNGEVYEETIMQDVYPALDEAARKLKLKEVELQEDNASPHQTVREKLKKHGAERASVWVARKAKITYAKQSAKSPDLNADDLYVWRVLNSHVQRRLWKEYRWQSKTTEMMWECIQHAWEHALTPAKIECAFRLMTPVMECIKAAKGGNKFTIPHTGIRKQMRAEGWDI